MDELEQLFAQSSAAFKRRYSRDPSDDDVDRDEIFAAFRAMADEGPQPQAQGRVPDTSLEGLRQIQPAGPRQAERLGRLGAALSRSREAPVVDRAPQGSRLGAAGQGVLDVLVRGPLHALGEVGGIAAEGYGAMRGVPGRSMQAAGQRAAGLAGDIGSMGYTATSGAIEAGRESGVGSPEHIRSLVGLGGLGLLAAGPRGARGTQRPSMLRAGAAARPVEAPLAALPPELAAPARQPRPTPFGIEPNLIEELGATRPARAAGAPQITDAQASFIGRPDLGVPEQLAGFEPTRLSPEASLQEFLQELDARNQADASIRARLAEETPPGVPRQDVQSPAFSVLEQQAPGFEPNPIAGYEFRQPQPQAGAPEVAPPARPFRAGRRKGRKRPPLNPL